MKRIVVKIRLYLWSSRHIYIIFIAIILLLSYSIYIENLSLTVIIGYIGLITLIPIFYMYREQIFYSHKFLSNTTITYSLFAIIGVELGTIDALVDDWKSKAFIWLILVTLLLVYVGIASIPPHLIISGIIGMYGGFWSITWAIIYKLTGHTIDYNIWVLPDVWLPEVVYWPIVAISITIYFASLIFTYKSIKLLWRRNIYKSKKR